MRVRTLLAAFVAMMLVGSAAQAGFTLSYTRTAVTSGANAGMDVIKFYAALLPNAPERTTFGATGLQNVAAIMTLDGFATNSPSAAFSYKLISTNGLPEVDSVGLSQMGAGTPLLRGRDFATPTMAQLGNLGTHIGAGIAKDSSTIIGTVLPTPTTPGSTDPTFFQDLQAYQVPVDANPASPTWGQSAAPNPTTWNFFDDTTGWKNLAAKTVTGRTLRVEMTNPVQIDPKVIVDSYGTGTGQSLGAIYAVAVVPSGQDVRIHNPQAGFGLAANKGPISEFDFSTAAIPEPGTLSLLGIAVFGLLARRRRAA